VGKGGQVMEDDLYLLGIAGNASVAWGPEASRDSHIYRWDHGLGLLQLHQVLEPAMRVSSMQLLQQGRETYLVLTSFSDVQCQNSGDGAGNVTGSNITLAAGNVTNSSNISLAAGNVTDSSNMTGASSNETDDASNEAPEDPGAALSTGRAVTILQWDRVTKMFNRLMAVTDTDSLDVMGIQVPRGERRIHDAALVLAVEDAVHAEVVVTSDDLMLLGVSSVSTGLLLYEWRFAKVTGLYGASTLEVDSDGSRAFVAGPGSSAVALVALEVCVHSIRCWWFASCAYAGLKACSQWRGICCCLCVHSWEILQETKTKPCLLT